MGPRVGRRPRILVAATSLQPPGGENAVAVAIVEALKDEADVTLLEWSAHDLAAVNRYYGSRLQPGDFQRRRIWPAWPALGRAIGVRGDVWKRALLLREIRRQAGAFDLVISAQGEIDVPGRAVQYIHFPWGYWPGSSGTAGTPDDSHWFHRYPALLRLYYACCHRIAPVSPARISRNRTLVNSHWTGEQFTKRYGGETTTLYPPIREVGAVTTWHERRNTFTVFGMIVRHKRIEMAIDILDRVRALGHDVSLQIIGSAAEQRYLGEVRRFVEARPWSRLDLDLSRAQVVEMLARGRYGLHAMRDEHFGIAVAEMAAAGCVVFVPDDGGQREIVGSAEVLRWSSAEDAVAKIDRVLRDEQLQRGLHAALVERSRTFSSTRFRDTLRAVVRDLLDAEHRDLGNAADRPVHAL